MSAIMHNTAFLALELDIRYELKSIKAKDLPIFASTRLRELDVRGANITIPHKISMLNFLDVVDPTASRIGAVNTIVNEEGKLKGYNTDGIGAIRALKEAYGDLSGTKVVLVGAGGAARAIGYHLSLLVKELIVHNRTLSRAVTLAKDLSDLPECRASISASHLQMEHLNESLEGADILVNATSLGMSPSINESPVERDLIHPNLFVFDSVYNPLRTRLLEEAREAGARTLSGLDMLVYQGTASFTLWTGYNAPQKLMKKAVEKALRDR